MASAGGGGGGGHGGGHGGGVGHAGPHGGFHGGFHHHAFYGGGFYLGIGYPWGYYYPGYYGYYGPPYYSAYPVAAPVAVGHPSLSTPETLPPPSAAPGPFARIEVRVPDDAEVWFEEVRTAQTGPIRQFVSPRLEPGEEYAYEIRARWLEDGRSVTRSRRIMVQAGRNVRVDFVAPDRAPPPAPQP
jgi:uncharacterized protein (TIGR03000 family)